MDYLLVLKPGDELLARGNSFTTCLSPCILTPWIQFSADLEAVIVCWFYHKPFDYHLRYLCFQLKLCLHLFWLIWAAKLVVDRKFNIFTFISSKGGRGGHKKMYNQSSGRLWGCIFPAVCSSRHISVRHWCTRMCRPLIYYNPSFSLSQCSSPNLLPCAPLPFIINVIVSRVGRRQRRGQGGRSGV